MKLTLAVKMIYGRPLTYPACEKSRRLAELMDKKTFAPHHITLLQETGFEIVYE